MLGVQLTSPSFSLFTLRLGSTGAQANYTAGCSNQDALAYYHVGLGEKATTLNPGLMLDDGGVLAEDTRLQNILGISDGHYTQRDLYTRSIKQCIQAT